VFNTSQGRRISAFRSAVTRALNAEDPVALRLAIQKAADFGLKTTREQTLLAELQKGAAVKVLALLSHPSHLSQPRFVAHRVKVPTDWGVHALRALN